MIVTRQMAQVLCGRLFLQGITSSHTLGGGISQSACGKGLAASHGIRKTFLAACQSTRKNVVQLLSKQIAWTKISVLVLVPMRIEKDCGTLHTKTDLLHPKEMDSWALHTENQLHTTHV